MTLEELAVAGGANVVSEITSKYKDERTTQYHYLNSVHSQHDMMYKTYQKIYDNLDRLQLQYLPPYPFTLSTFVFIAIAIKFIVKFVL